MGTKPPIKRELIRISLLCSTFIISHFYRFVNYYSEKPERYIENAHQNGTIKDSKGSDCMAEKIKSGKNQYKTLRAYLVYDYIFKKTHLSSPIIRL